MQVKSNLILAVSPGDMSEALALGAPIAHLSYRVGKGLHLFRSSIPVAARGGLLAVDDTGFDGRGEATPFCHEVLRECAARGGAGVVCLFSAPPLRSLCEMLAQLEELLAERGWPLYVSEPYAPSCKRAKVLIPTALSGGSLRQRLSEAAARYTPGRLALWVERVAQDFYLPSPTGQGTPLSQEELRALMEERQPSVFFSDELCAHYFTFMSRQNGAHFILFDDLSSVRKKLHVARSLGISDALLPYAPFRDLLPDLLRVP